MLPRTRAFRRHKMRVERTRAMKLATRNGPYYPWRGYVDADMDNAEEAAKAHVKYPKQTDRKRVAKRQTNKLVRRTNAEDFASRHGFYRRAFDRAWYIT